VVCGYGRSGQNLARLLESEGFHFIALDVDPKRVKEAAAAGEHVVYGDAARREVLIAAGLLRARALVVTIADSSLALRILAHVRELKPGLPVVVRMLDDTEIDLLRNAGATAVLAEIMEGSLMLASHTLISLGVPLNRVLRRIRDTREQRYSLLRGFFHGESDESEDAAHVAQRLLHSVLITPGAAAIGKTLAALNLGACNVEIKAVRRPGITAQAPQPDARIEAGDVLVLYGAERDCAAAEIRVMQGERLSKNLRQ
ncbi:MAG: NAD-binding protein, partial [Betaproteobacteria bacterium]